MPKDVLPQSIIQNKNTKIQNENDDSKKSKLVLAQIKNPLNLLGHKIKFV